MYEIIIGRNEEDRQRFGLKGTILLGKHYVKMGQTTSLSNEIYVDVARSHVIFISGKRGSGKSFSIGVIAEGIAMLPEEIRHNLSAIIIDTMGVFWTMKYENKKEARLLEEWDLKTQKLGITIFTPTGYFQEFKDRGIPTDFAFSIKPRQLTPEDWCMTFGIGANEPTGILITRVINNLKKYKKNYDMPDIINEVRDDVKTDQYTKDAAENFFTNAESWGLFGKEGLEIKNLVSPGQITVLDVSCYATSSKSNQIRALVIGLVAQKLFDERLTLRREEEFEEIKQTTRFFSEEEKSLTKKLPLVWFFVDEAHEFLPKKGSTIATQPLLTLLREGRQPGVSLVLASQQPGQIHTDVMTQSDIVLSHRLTAKIDIDALGLLMQSYLREDLNKYLNELPRVAGAGIIFDDTNERLYPMRVRPRITWHGGEAPIAIPSRKEQLFAV